MPFFREDATTKLRADNGYCNGFQCKLLLILLLVICDLSISSVSDYDFPANGNASRVALALFALSVLAQFGIMSVFYSMMAQTFPFQVGLVGFLTSRFHKLFIIQVVYLLLSCFAGGMRVVMIRTEKLLGPEELLTTPFFAVMSSLQKLVAPIYYAINLKSSFEIGDPAYYTEEAWKRAAASMMEGRERLAEMREKYRTAA